MINTISIEKAKIMAEEARPLIQTDFEMGDCDACDGGCDACCSGTSGGGTCDSGGYKEAK